MECKVSVFGLVLLRSNKTKIVDPGCLHFYYFYSLLDALTTKWKDWITSVHQLKLLGKGNRPTSLRT